MGTCSKILGALALILGLTACSSLPFVNIDKAHTRVFQTDYSTAWTAAFDAVSMGRDIIRVQNRELGIIETSWVDYTEQKHFLEVFSDEQFFLRARFRLKVQLREGRKNGQQAVIVQILREEQSEKTFLAGWSPSDNAEPNIEAAVLYRVGRLIAMQEHNDKLAAKAAETNEAEMN
jgi:hypothetical protein